MLMAVSSVVALAGIGVAYWMYVATGRVSAPTERTCSQALRAVAQQVLPRRALSALRRHSR